MDHATARSVYAWLAAREGYTYQEIGEAVGRRANTMLYGDQRARSGKAPWPAVRARAIEELAKLTKEYAQ